MLCTGLTGWDHRSDRSECWPCSHVALRSDRWCGPIWLVRAELMQMLCFRQVVCMHSFRGSCIGSGERACVQAELFMVFYLWFGGLRSSLEHSLVSDVSSRCPCLRCQRLVLFRWSFSLPFFGFRSLVGVSFIHFVSFSFLLGYYMCVLSMHSSKGRLRTMCGLRTGGLEGPIRWPKRGGSEWEPIKILLGGDWNSDKMNLLGRTPKSHALHFYLPFAKTT
jgi:hypothetical protein